MSSCGTFQKLRPLTLLTHLSSCYDSACLKVSSNSVSWLIYLKQGKITYASHTVDPFDRLDCHLRRLSYQVPEITSDTRSQLRLMFETDIENQLEQNFDYQAICELVKQQYLNSTQAALLIEGLVKEVVESFLLVKEGTYELKGDNTLQDFCMLELQPIVESCQKQLQSWMSLGTQIWSPYQRPYFPSRDRSNQQLPLEVRQKLSAMLRGFSFRHLGVLLNQDEFQLARSLHPYIASGTILLEHPCPPFDRLPNFEQSVEKSSYLGDASNRQLGKSNGSKQDTNTNPITTDKTVRSGKALYPQSSTSRNISNTQRQETGNTVSVNQFTTHKGSAANGTASASKNIYKVVCVDDSQTMLDQIKYFLDDESFLVFGISDPVKALMQIVRLKPDLILLDVNMAGINGYELCRLLRNHSLFKSKPIIMVTGNTGVIDRVKARLMGSSGYLTKPFVQSDLLKVIFRHLS